MNELSKTDLPTKREGKTIWLEAEDSYLLKLVKSKGKKNWVDISEELNLKFDTSKTGKQCRERYRNYVDPSLEKCEWKPQEKILFLFLHNIYKNQWSQISKFLNQRSDIAIKNYFYSVIRKALRYYQKGTIPPSILNKPAKLFQLYSTLELLRTEYLPIIDESAKLPKNRHKEKIIINLLIDRKATDQSIIQYQENLIKKYKECNSETQLPYQLIVDLGAIDLSREKMDELLAYENINPISELKQVVIVKLVYKQLPSPLSLNVTSPNIISPAPHIARPNSTFNLPPRYYFPPFGLPNPMIPLAQPLIYPFQPMPFPGMFQHPIWNPRYPANMNLEPEKKKRKDE